MTESPSRAAGGSRSPGPGGRRGSGWQPAAGPDQGARHGRRRALSLRSEHVPGRARGRRRRSGGSSCSEGPALSRVGESAAGDGDCDTESENAVPGPPAGGPAQNPGTCCGPGPRPGYVISRP